MKTSLCGSELWSYNMVSHFRYCNEIRKHNKCLFQEEEDEGEGHQKQHGRHKSNNAIIMGKVNLHYSYSPRPQRKKDVGGVRERVSWKRTISWSIHSREQEAVADNMLWRGCVSFMFDLKIIQFQEQSRIPRPRLLSIFCSFFTQMTM